MSASHDSQKRLNGKFHRFLQERIEKANPRRELKHEKAKRLSKLEAIAGKLRRGENVQNRQLQTWLNEDEYAQLEIEWQGQLANATLVSGNLSTAACNFECYFAWS